MTYKRMSAPTNQVAETSSVDAGVVVERMLASEGTVGFDAARDEYVDLVAAGIIDAKNAVRIALENAASVASVLLRTAGRCHPGRTRVHSGAWAAAPPGARAGDCLLLAVDRDYRRRALAGQLPTIAPRRFNPEKRAWLPVMHTERGGWHFTVLFSHTARAHELDRTDDWVVVYFYDGEHEEGQQTVVTETHGELKGKRVVRGREADCRRLYGRK